MKSVIARLAHRILGDRPPPLSFRGWRVVAGAFVTSMVAFGAVYSYSVFAPHLSETFGISAASTSMILSLSTGTAFAVSAAGGLLSEVFGCRVLAVAGMLTIGAGLLLGASSTTVLTLYLSYGVLIGFGTGLAYVPAFAAVQRWFVRWRGLASCVAAAGIGVGTLLISPMAELLDAFGNWRVEFRICAVLAAVVGIGGAVLLVDAPEDTGDFPDDRPRPPDASPGSDAETLKAALGLPPFLWMYGGVFLVSVAVVTPYAHLVASAMASGWGARKAASLLSILGIASILGRFLVAAVADRLGRRVIFIGCCAGVALATLVWAVADGSFFPAFALIFGGFYGGFVALLPAFTADHFGRRHAAGVMGLIYSSRALAALLGPPLVAVMVGHGTGYRLPLEGVAVVAAAGVCLLLRVRPARQGEDISGSQRVHGSIRSGALSR